MIFICLSQMGASDEQTTIVVQLHIAEQRLKAEIKRQMSILQDLSKNQVSMVNTCLYILVSICLVMTDKDCESDPSQSYL